ncbi:hypothetical protein BJV78DRAFT_1245779 [Lactifluus subvellereus]|nr:hypothetical protein BJV78DRAFT_1245779 [Lactifluus subvellereus]
MRLFKLFSLLSLLFGVRASSLDSRSPAPHPLDTRDLLDVCASINVNLEVPDLLGILTAVGVIDICLCLSALPLFLETNIVALLAVEIAGEQPVSNILTKLINDGAANSNCVFPDHSIPACVDGNPCAFQCTDGFTPSPPVNPTTCVCAAPSVVCNGKCVAAGSCPSSVSTPNKKRWVGSGSCAEMGPEWAACGIFGGGARAWECINTARDLESCGGCVLPLTPYTPIGQDCTSLPGVADVSCLAGECVVHRCMRGYVPARDGTHCVSKHSKVSHGYVAEDEAELARVYGLEHVPLQKH